MGSHLKEITCTSFLNNNLLANHCLTTENGLEVCLNNRSAAEVVHIRFDNSDEESLNIFTSIDFPSTIKPTQHLCPNPTVLYNSSKASQKQHLTLDPLLLPELSIDTETWFVWTKLAQQTDRSSSYLAVLTNFGHCMIKRKNMNNHKWTEVFADLTGMWKSHLETNLQSDKQGTSTKNSVYENFIRQSNEIQITAFDWATQQSKGERSLSIVCTSALGHAIFFRIPPKCRAAISSEARIEHVADLAQSARINHVQWIIIETGESFLCTSNVLGHIHLYRVIEDSITKCIESVELCATLIEWQMICNIEWLELEYDSDTKQLIGIVCVGSRLVIVFIPVGDITAFELIYHSIQQSFITGELFLIDKNVYMVDWHFATFIRIFSAQLSKQNESL